MRVMIRFMFVVLLLSLPARMSRAGGGVYVETNLISNNSSAAQAQIYDPNLINPWGMSYTTTGPLWVSDQGSGLSTLYGLNNPTPVTEGLVVPIPNLGGAAPSGNDGPTGQVSTLAPGITTASTDFQVDGSRSVFIFANLDGSISGWTPGHAAAIEASVSGASFTGLAIGNTSTGAAEIYAADQNSGKVYIFNSAWQQVGTLTDPNLPAGYKAFNVQNIGGHLYVTYMNPSGAGGIVDEYSTNGTLMKQLINDTAGAHLDGAWGLAMAPTNFGKFGGDLLVGNNAGDGFINAYNSMGVWQGQLVLNTGQNFSVNELWGLTFGNGGKAGSPDTLYFDAGLAGGTNGLIGSINLASVPEPSTAVLGLIGSGVVLGSWKWRNRRRGVVA